MTSQSNAEWAASLTVADLDMILNRCVQERDFQGLRAALTLMAVKDPNRAEYWREMLRFAVEVGQIRATQRDLNARSATTSAQQPAPASSETPHAKGPFAPTSARPIAEPSDHNERTIEP